MHRNDLIERLQNYNSPFMEEMAYVHKALNYIRQHPDCFLRSLFPAHVTASSWVVNPARDRVLLMHHRKLDRWFQPGGHTDGDHDVLAVAIKETEEETGLAREHIRLVSDRLFDVDIHTIPSNAHDPQHQHIDLRFLLEVDDRLPVPGNDESHDIRWVSVHQAARFNRNRSTHRMIEKTRRMRAQA